MRVAGQYGHDGEYVASTDITWGDGEHGLGPTGLAIRTGRTQVNQNIAANPLMAPWREKARTRGYQSSIALPLKGDLGPFGALSIYAREPDAFSDEEINLLINFAAEQASAILRLRARAPLA